MRYLVILIKEAYQILSDPDKRAHYDSFGHISSEGMFTDQDFDAGFNNIFGNLFEWIVSIYKIVLEQ